MRLRNRATVVVELEGNILLAEDKHGLILLPGGGIDAGEPPLVAAARELYEETGLIATHALYLFEHLSSTNRHHVFWMTTEGNPVASDDAIKLHFLDPDESTDTVAMSPATREIIGKFRKMKDACEDYFALFAEYPIP